MTSTHLEVAAVILGFVALIGAFVFVFMRIPDRDMLSGFPDPDAAPEDVSPKPQMKVGGEKRDG